MTVRNVAVILFATVSLGGCAAGLSGSIDPAQISGKAAGVFGIPAATVAAQLNAEIVEIRGVVVELQMLRAQLDGAPIVLPSLPVPPVLVTPPSGDGMTPPSSDGKLPPRLPGSPPPVVGNPALRQRSDDPAGEKMRREWEQIARWGRHTVEERSALARLER